MDTDVLRAFIQVIDAGSFARAAERFHISATAIMKQMNGLEAQVGVPLLQRTNRGIHATAAGSSLYVDAKYIVHYERQARERAQHAAGQQANVIRIGTSLLTPCKELIERWNTISPTHPQFKINIVPFADDAARWPAAIRTFWNDVDVMVGAYDPADRARSFHDVPLGEYRFCVAVSREHRFADRDMLTVRDLYGERLVVLQRCMSPCIDAIREALVSEHPQIQIKDHPQQYAIDVFNRCEESRAVLLTVDGWRDVHPALVTIPVDWTYTLPYGILYPLNPSNRVALFVDALQETVVAHTSPDLAV